MLAPIDNWDSASFRDGRGRVFLRDRRVFRALAESGRADWEALRDSPVWQRLQAQRMVVKTWDAPHVSSPQPAASVIEHEPLEFHSYPYEWPFAWLRRAGLLCVDLLEQLVPEGFVLADGTARNLAFDGARPYLLDVLSITPMADRIGWPGLNEFLESTVYPLMLTAHLGIGYHAWLRGAPQHALPTLEVARLFRLADTLKPGVLPFLKLKNLLDSAGQNGRGAVLIGDRRDQSLVLLATVKRLRKLLDSLRSRKTNREWLSYGDTAGGNYDESGRMLKRDLVERYTQAHASQGLVWDVGCNTGEYTRIVARHARLVVAFDADAGVVDVLADQLLAESVSNVLPLVIDLASPSPAFGWNASETRPFLTRSQADLVLALAVLHHLVLVAHVPAAMVLQTLSRAGKRCVLEFVDPSDAQVLSMTARLGRGHQRMPGREEFEAQARAFFTVEAATPLTPTRTLYLLRSAAA